MWNTIAGFTAIAFLFACQTDSSGDVAHGEGQEAAAPAEGIGQPPPGLDQAHLPRRSYAPEHAGQVVTNFVRAGHLVTDGYVQLLVCDEMWAVRNWVYARHGYAFTSVRAQKYFADQPGYQCDPAVSAGTVAPLLSAVDKQNAAKLLAHETSIGCSMDPGPTGPPGCP